MIRIVFSLILFSLSTGVFANNLNTMETDASFSLSIEDKDVSVIIKGRSEYFATPSSYSIYMNDEKNRKCAIHLLNFRTPLGIGTYDVQIRDTVTTGAVCILEINKKRERFASESGTFTISEFGRQRSSIKGHFEMVMIGNISGKKYLFRGNVESFLIQ